MSKIIIIEHNSNDKDTTRAYFLKGEKGETGETGNGIASIEKTSTTGNIDTYTITYTNGATDTFQVANGEGSTVIIDNLTDTSTDKALSSNQGRILKNMIDEMSSNAQTNIITAYLTNENHYLTTLLEKLPLTQFNQVGSKFTIGTDTTKILVGAGVNYVKIQAQVYFLSLAPEDRQRSCSIMVNNNVVAETGVYASGGTHVVLNISPVVVRVQENDYIRLEVDGQYGSSTSTQDLLYGNIYYETYNNTQLFTYITVEAVG